MLSRFSLRSQLFTSYLFLLLVTLLLLGALSLVFLSARQAPPQVTWAQLSPVLPTLGQAVSGTTLVDVLRSEGRAAELLAPYAETHGVRVLLVMEDERGFFVQYDSDGQYVVAQSISLQVEANYYDRERVIPTRDNELLYGTFFDADSSEWLFVGYNRELRRMFPNYESVTVLVSEPRSNESLGSVLAEFGEAFFLPMLQAALIGILVAFVLAYFISRSLGQPLRSLAYAASEVAAGNYNHQVPERGPVEIHEVAVAFNRMSAEVRNTQESQREFLANVSHDLKTPLTSIEGYSRAIMDGVAKEPENAARIIHEEANRLTRMVIELTDLARLQAGRLSMKTDALDVGEIVAAIGQRLAVVAARKDIDLQVQAAPMPYIAGDGDRLVQVVTNLISNAIKYTQNGGKVQVLTQVRERGVEIIVADNGIGIPAEDLPHVFDRFFQVDKARGPKRGTGLGLAITREIVLAHGGTIDVRSPGKNQGTTVTVWLPSPQLSTVVSQRQ